jgi:V/A-type H+-transporting ATPase subunit E
VSAEFGGHQAEGYKKLMEAVFQQSLAKASALIDESEKKALATLDESERYAIKKSEEIISSYKDMAEIEARKEVSKAEVDARMGLLKLKESYVDLVLEEAKKKLQSFAATPEYKTVILEEIKLISKKMPVGQLLLNPDDVSLLGIDKIKRAVGAGVEITPKQIGIGGFIAMRKDGKASVDRSIDSILESERKALRGKIADILFG